MANLDELLTKLAASDPQARQEATWELGNLGPAAAPAAAPLAGALEEEALRGCAGWALVKIGGPALDALTHALKSPREAVRLAALSALWKIAAERPDPAIIAMVDSLQDVSPNVRAYTAWSLGEVGRIAAPAAEPLSTILTTDPEPKVREQAARALGRIGEPSAAVVQGLTTALGDREREVRWAAVEALLELASTRRAAELRAALPALEQSARRGARSERGLFRSAAAAIRASAPYPGDTSGSQNANLPRPATAPEPDAARLPRTVP